MDMNRIEAVKQFVSKNKYNIVLLFIYFIITTITMFHHEIWRDEAQVWCLTRDLNFLEIFNTSRIEGHPFLWSLIVTPFSKLGVNVFSLQIISLIFVFVSVVYFVFKSPFSNFFKTIFVLSAGMLYYLPIITRNYALIPLFLFILAEAYPQRTSKPWNYTILLILLSQTHILMLGFCAILFILFGIEKLKECIENKNYKKLIPPLILAVYFLVMLLLFYSVPGENKIITNYTNRGYSISNTIMTFMYTYWNLVAYIPILTLILYFSFFVILFRLFVLDKKMFLTFFGGFVYIIAVLNKFWFGGIPYQKVFIPFLILVFCLWVIKNNNLNNSVFAKEKLLKFTVSILFIISFITSYGSVGMDIKYNFSGAKQLSEYIRKNLNSEDTFIIIGLPYTFTTLSAYIPDKKLYLYQTGKYLTFYNFNKEDTQATAGFPEESKYYIVQNNYELKEDMGFQKVFSTQKENLSGIMEQEVFSIYKKENLQLN